MKTISGQMEVRMSRGLFCSFVLLLACLVPRANAVPTFDSCATPGTSNGVNTVAATITAIAGHLIAFTASQGTDATGAYTASDTAGNKWIPARAGYAVDDNNNVSQTTFYAVAKASGSTTITADWGAAKNTQIAIVCMLGGVAVENTSNKISGSSFGTMVLEQCRRLRRKPGNREAFRGRRGRDCNRHCSPQRPSRLLVLR